MPDREQSPYPDGLPDAANVNAELRRVVPHAYRLGQQRLPKDPNQPALKVLERRIRALEAQIRTLWQHARWGKGMSKGDWIRGMVHWVREHQPPDAPDVVLDTWYTALRSLAETSFPGDTRLLRELDRLLPSRERRSALLTIVGLVEMWAQRVQ